MKNRLWAVGVVGVLSSCATWKDSVTLPLGYHHDGVKAIVVRPVEPSSYTDQLAVKCLQEEVQRFTGLFVVVHDEDQADLEMIAAGVEGQSTSSRGEFGGQVLSIEGKATGASQSPATRPEIAIYDKQKRLIYENAATWWEDPNRAMKPAANWLLREYAKGR